MNKEQMYERIEGDEVPAGQYTPDINEEGRFVLIPFYEDAFSTMEDLPIEVVIGEDEKLVWELENLLSAREAGEDGDEEADYFNSGLEDDNVNNPRYPDYFPVEDYHANYKKALENIHSFIGNGNGCQHYGTRISKRHAVLLSGQKGVGKTTFIDQICRTEAEDYNTIVIRARNTKQLQILEETGIAHIHEKLKCRNKIVVVDGFTEAFAPKVEAFLKRTKHMEQVLFLLGMDAEDFSDELSGKDVPVDYVENWLVSSSTNLKSKWYKYLTHYHLSAEEWSETWYNSPISLGTLKQMYKIAAKDPDASLQQLSKTLIRE